MRLDDDEVLRAAVAVSAVLAVSWSAWRFAELLERSRLLTRTVAPARLDR